jgi:hypothetical protein
MSPPNVAKAKFYNSGPDLFTSGLFEVKIGVASWVSRGRGVVAFRGMHKKSKILKLKQTLDSIQD